METHANLFTVHTNSSHTLNHLPEKIRLVFATPHFYWKNRTGKALQCMTAPGWTAVGQMLKTDLLKHPTAKRDTHLLCYHNTAPWKSHVICCLLSSGWNKIGEDWGGLNFHIGKLACSKGNVVQAPLQANTARGIPHTYQHIHREPYTICKHPEIPNKYLKNHLCSRGNKGPAHTQN